MQFSIVTESLSFHCKKIDTECYGRNQRGAAKPILPLALNMIKQCCRPAKETNRDESRDENFDISFKFFTHKFVLHVLCYKTIGSCALAVRLSSHGSN